MILMIDNYDSFTYNLVQLIGGITPDIRVIRNDAMTVPEIEGLNPSHIVLSPGPGYPKDAGICEDVIRALFGKYPILGVCLGHQAICEVFGARITHAARLMPFKPPSDTGKKLLCPMPGLVRSISVAEGNDVKAGDMLAVIEAMKMENVLRAECDGVVKKIFAKPGDSLAVDAVIMEFV